MEQIVRIENYIVNWIKSHAKYIFINMAFGIMVYFMMISENLVNSYDGIWNTSHFIAEAWETSLGRGLLHYIDKVRAGVVAGPLNTALALLIISIASTVIIDFYVMENKKIGMLVSLLLIVNPVVCDTLSYCFTSVGYGMAFLFSVLSARCICCRYRIAGILFGAIFLALSLGCYQAYFGVTCLLLLLQVMKMLLDCDDIKRIAEFLIKGILAIIVGGIFYSIISTVLLKKYGIEMASYGGASEVSVGRIIALFPESIKLCYKEFYGFFVKSRMGTTVFDKTIILFCGIVLLVFICVFRHCFVIWCKNKVYVLCFLACVCLVPVVCNAIVLLVGIGMSTLMSMGMVAGVALVPAIMLFIDGRGGFFLRRSGYILLLLLLWVNILTVEKDQLALKEGRTATAQLTDSVVESLIADGYLEDGIPIAFVGKPCENGLFAKRPAWNSANWYARFGDWWTGAANNRRSWIGVLEECCGIQLNLCSAEKYEEMHQKGVFSEMPIFPAEGSIKEIDGVIVVKISDAY
jgi:hypothetical protein